MLLLLFCYYLSNFHLAPYLAFNISVCFADFFISYCIVKQYEIRYITVELDLPHYGWFLFQLRIPQHIYALCVLQCPLWRNPQEASFWISWKAPNLHRRLSKESLKFSVRPLSYQADRHRCLPAGKGFVHKSVLTCVHLYFVQIN